MSTISRPSTRAALAAFALLAAACAKSDVPADTAAPPAPAFVVSTGLATPESVLWDATRSVWYVSNINGNPPQKDDNGYILRLGAGGEVMDSLPFIAGSDDDITLHAPKGMALQGDTLWVADIDALRGFDVTTGKAVASVDLTPLGVLFANDVAVGNDGGVYLTDTGISFGTDGSVAHSGSSQVVVVRARVASVAVTLPKGSAANGIAWDAARNAWQVVSYATPNVFEWVPSAKEATILGTGPGGGDGLLVLGDGRSLYSSWADSSLTLFANGTSTTLRKGLVAPADLGYDPARRLVAVPLFTSDRIEFWSLDAPLAAIDTVNH